jgi:dTMP kinase
VRGRGGTDACGRLITFEGGEGAGKSTQVGYLAQVLRQCGIAVHTTREPGGSPGAERIRAMLLQGPDAGWSATAEVLLHYAARCDHVERTIGPALASGRWVICDRFADSTLAYQGYGLGVDPSRIREIDRLVLNGLQPDLTLMLDIAPTDGLARVRARDGRGDRYEAMDEAFHARVRQGFLAIARDAPERCVVIDGGGDVETVREAVLAQTAARLGLEPAP